MPIIPGPPPVPTIILYYGQSVNEASLINGIQNKETIQLNVEGEGTIPLSTSAIAENWVRVVFKQDKINYVYETKSGWSTDKNIPETYIKPENLSDEVMDVINSAVTAAIELPPVSADDNGKVFAVIDGQWTKVDLVDLMLEQGLYTPDLAKDSWSMISKISASGTAANYYAVGDCKAVALNGTMGTLALDMTTYVYILGFDHNSAIEGNGISFGGFKTSAGNDATDICLVDSGYWSSTIDGSKHFNMNHWGETYHGPRGDENRSYNYGGWAGCDMRYDILGSTDVAPENYGELPTEGREGHNPTSTCATNPVANTLMSCLPSALRAVMKPITKYTDNVGGGNGDVEANVTATIDYLPLFAEHEIHGPAGQDDWRSANTHEIAHQAQYAYYATGNSKIKKMHSDTEEAALWWLRSLGRASHRNFCCVDGDGVAYDDRASGSFGVAPLFKV